MLQHLQCRHYIIWIWSVFLHSEVSATDQRMRQSVAVALSLSQNKRLPLYQTLWECLICHYSIIYPILPMNLSTYLSIRRQRNPLCAKKFLVLVELDGCRFEVAPPYCALITQFNFSTVICVRGSQECSITFQEDNLHHQKTDEIKVRADLSRDVLCSECTSSLWPDPAPELPLQVCPLILKMRMNLHCTVCCCLVWLLLILI